MNDERNVVSTKLSIPQTGRTSVTAGAFAGGGSCRPVARQRMVAIARLAMWEKIARPQIAAAAQRAGVIESNLSTCRDIAMTCGGRASVPLTNAAALSSNRKTIQA